MNIAQAPPTAMPTASDRASFGRAVNSFGARRQKLETGVEVMGSTSQTPDGCGHADADSRQFGTGLDQGQACAPTPGGVRSVKHGSAWIERPTGVADRQSNQAGRAAKPQDDPSGRQCRAMFDDIVQPLLGDQGEAGGVNRI